MLHYAEVIFDEVTRKLTGPTGCAALLLLASIIISAIVVFLKSGSPVTFAGFIEFMFPRPILNHPSARADFLFWITRKFVMLPLALPTGISVAAAVAYATHSVLQAIFGPGAPVAAPGTVTLILFTVSMLLAYDFSYFLYHNLQHRLPILWELHKVHHSAEVMVGTTKDRVHPLDEIMNKAWDGLMTGPIYGVWLMVALDPVELTILGINVYVLRNIIMMDFVRHTHLKISFGRVMNQVILCPHYHQLHHSTNPQHYDKNFGLMLTLWDRLFGTLSIPKPDESFTFGLQEREASDYQSLAGLYILPLRRMAGHLRFTRRRPQLIGMSAGSATPVHGDQVGSAS